MRRRECVPLEEWYKKIQASGLALALFNIFIGTKTLITHTHKHSQKRSVHFHVQSQTPDLYKLQYKHIRSLRNIDADCAKIYIKIC